MIFKLWVFFTIGFIFSILSVCLIYFLFKNINLTSLNYRGKKVVKSLGVSIVLFTLLIFIIRIYFKDILINNPEYKLISANMFIVYLTVIVFFLGLTGFVDDIFGSAQYKGLKGHFKALSQGKITTGLVKALTGLIIGFIVSWFFGGSVIVIFIRTFTFALCINFFNLLDLRPGRSLKIYILTSVLLIIVIMARSYSFDIMFLYIHLIKSNIFLIILFIIPAFSLLYFDLKELAFLGDAGSNILGGIIGFFIIAYFSLAPTVAALIVLVFLHVIAEISSFTEIIEKNTLLSWFDNLGRLN
jgi:UDP-GlcNAc:undecaprenyl-phosphate GlcNAc-1-phosphate transferase